MTPHLWRRFTLQCAAVTALSITCCSDEVVASQLEDVFEVGRPILTPDQDVGLSFGVSATLVAGISFIMIIQYYVNAKDDDIRRYTWTVLCTTVSIFCSVLIFDAFAELVHSLFGQVSQGLMLYINMLLMFSWSTALHVCIYYFPDKPGYALLLAHATGFAAINGWGTVQQYPFFSGNALMAMLCVPLSFYGILVMTRMNEFAISCYVKWTDHRHARCENEVLEAENDVIGFCTSFQTVQAMRLLICGVMPKADGTETDAQMFSHTFMQSGILLLIGCVFLALASIVYLEEAECFGDESEEGSEHFDMNREISEKTSKPATPSDAVVRAKTAMRARFQTKGKEKMATTVQKARDATRKAMRRTVARGGGSFMMGGIDIVDDLQSTREQELEHQAREVVAKEGGPFSVKRLADCLVLYLAMTFAFSTFYAGYWLTATLRITFDKSLLGMGLAMMMSIFAFAGIAIMEPIAHKGGPSVHRIIHEIVQSLALLVGLSWERSFDVATEVLASFTASPTIATLLLAVFCSALLVPAWRYHMLPMVTHDGWKHGILPYKWKRKTIDDVILYLSDFRKKIATGEVYHEESDSDSPEMAEKSNSFAEGRQRKSVAPPPRESTFSRPRKSKSSTGKISESGTELATEKYQRQPNEVA